MDREEFIKQARVLLLNDTQPLARGCNIFKRLVPAGNEELCRMMFMGGCKYLWSVITILLNEESIDETQANTIQMCIKRVEYEIDNFTAELTGNLNAS